MINTIVCAFPGTGKSTLVERFITDIIVDCDIAHYKQWYANRALPPPFVYQEYIRYITTAPWPFKMALVSTHDEVLTVLRNYPNVRVACVYPRSDLKEEYLARYKKRGTPQETIDFIDKLWETPEAFERNVINRELPHKNSETVILGPGKHLTDFVLSQLPRLEKPL